MSGLSDGPPFCQARLNESLLSFFSLPPHRSPPLLYLPLPSRRYSSGTEGGRRPVTSPVPFPAPDASPLLRPGPEAVGTPPPQRAAAGRSPLPSPSLLPRLPLLLRHGRTGPDPAALGPANAGSSLPWSCRRRIRVSSLSPSPPLRLSPSHSVPLLTLLQTSEEIRSRAQPPPASAIAAGP